MTLYTLVFVCLKHLNSAKLTRHAVVVSISKNYLLPKFQVYFQMVYYTEHGTENENVILVPFIIMLHYRVLLKFQHFISASKFPWGDVNYVANIKKESLEVLTSRSDVPRCSER